MPNTQDKLRIVIKPIKHNWWTLPGDAIDLKNKINTQTWSIPIKPLTRIVVFGRAVEKFLIGFSGQLKFLPGDAKQWPWPWEKCEIPYSLDDLIEGHQIIPFGEPVTIKG